MKNTQIALAFVAVLGLSAQVQAATVAVELVAVDTQEFLSNPASWFSGSTATWSYDTVSGVVTGSGLFKFQPAINQSQPPGQLYTHNIDDLAVGAVGAASASSFECVDGGFSASVGVSICGTYTYGDNFIDESTVDYVVNNGIPGIRTLGGDDVDNPFNAIQQLTLYDGMTTDWDGTTLVASNLTLCGFESWCGYEMRFTAAVPVPAAAWLFGSALGLLGWMRRRKAN
jgi:hypothetical protein